MCGWQVKACCSQHWVYLFVRLHAMGCNGNDKVVNCFFICGCCVDEDLEAEQQQGKQTSSRRMGGHRNSLVRFFKAVRQRWAKAGEQVRAACARPASLLPSPLARARMAQVRTTT